MTDQNLCLEFYKCVQWQQNKKSLFFSLTTVQIHFSPPLVILFSIQDTGVLLISCKMVYTIQVVYVLCCIVSNCLVKKLRPVLFYSMYHYYILYSLGMHTKLSSICILSGCHISKYQEYNYNSNVRK